MPMYTYVDKNTGKSFDILRHFSEYDSLPTEEEANTAGLTAEEFKNAVWEKLIGAGIRVIKGEGWSGKGNW